MDESEQTPLMRRGHKKNMRKTIKELYEYEIFPIFAPIHSVLNIHCAHI